MRLRFIALAGVLLLAGAGATAQQSQPKRFTAKLAGTVRLSDVDDKYNAQVSSLEMPDPDATVEQKKLQRVKELIRQKFPYREGPKQKKSSSVMPPVLDVNYVADTLPQIPPDNYMAVSNGLKAVTVMNGSITVHDASTGAYQYRKTLLPFSIAVGLNNSIGSNLNYRFDPKVVYDPVADRFIVVMLNSTDQYNWIVFGFSKSNNPADTWNFYKFYGDYAHDTTWFDYPAISVTQNEVFLTGNKIFYDSSWQGGFRKSVVYQVRKQDGYNGDSLLTYQLWDSIQHNGRYLRCLYPLNPGDSLLGPEQYFLSNRNFDVSNDSVFIVKIPDTIGSTGAAITVVPVVASTSYGVPPDARQPDTSLTLATNDGRILGGFIKGSQMQFVSTSVNPGNGASAVYHGIIDNFATTPVMTGHIYSKDSLDFGYPNISYAGNVGSSIQSILSFEYSGPYIYPGLGAIYFDGTDYSDLLTIHAGDSSIKMLGQKEQRWGDYSGSQPDRTIPGSVWVEGIYGRKDKRYGNWMARLGSPYRTAIPRVATKAPSKLYPNPGFEFVTYEFNVASAQDFSFVIFDAQGRVAARILDNYCAEGKNMISFNIASLTPGTYFLRAQGNKGEQIEVHSFVKR